MIFVKVTDRNGVTLSIEAVQYPSYFKREHTNNILVGCSLQEAEGIQLPGKIGLCLIEGRSLGEFETNDMNIATFVSLSEYEEYDETNKLVDPEDESPQIPEDVPEETILTRAELTQRIESLEEQNEFLQNCILEMSEIIYS